MRRGRGLRLRDRGTATVEFAIVVPVLLMLVFGIIDFGRMASYHVRLSAAARAAAQAVAVGEDESAAAAAAAAVFQGGPLSVSVLHRCGNPPGNREMAQVKLTYNFQFVTPVAVLAGLTGGEMTAPGAVPCRG